MTRFVSRVLFGCLFVAWLAGPVSAQQTGKDVTAIQDVIASQIAAFRAGDGSRAYSFASPGIQRIFPSPGVFMRMVEQGYEPVFRPRSFAFMEHQMVGADDALQFVDVVGPDGAAWVAAYTLRRQPDGTWKITGCQLKPGVGA
ncbi:DUF4864 domain-containing protein [Microbaculum sp. FT89]|uniref:DUF4864 domain-containing protein n=1 Tax=Microbaculum sp. FT89 TaxID=3447298 RepID=UPI003F5323A0